MRRHFTLPSLISSGGSISVLAEHDLVAARWTPSGTHTGGWGFRREHLPVQRRGELLKSGITGTTSVSWNNSVRLFSLEHPPTGTSRALRDIPAHWPTLASERLAARLMTLALSVGAA